MSGSQYDIPPPPSETPTQPTPHTEVIQNGNGPVSITTDTQGQIKVLPLRTTEEISARERERKARTTLLMALPEDHLAKFHKMTDAKEMWEAIKSRFGGNDESKKMQKYILKQQFEGFSVSNSEGLHKGYDRFQSLLSQLEIHGAGVSTEDANQKFLRSLPSAWSQVSLIMRTKPGVDSLSFDDLYNNLRVFENDIKGSNASSSTCPQLDHEDLEQLDEFDLEEMDLKWQVAMISMRMKKFYKKTGRKLQFDAKEPVGFDKTKVECYNCHKTGHFARECRTKGNQDSRRRDAWNSGNKDGRRSGKQEDSKALVTIDGEGVDWTSHTEEEEDYALMACNSSGSDTEESDLENQPLYDRFVTAEGMHAVPPHMIGNYMPSGPDIEIDYSQFKYSLQQSQPSESKTQTSDFDTFWIDVPIIEEYESDSDDYCVSKPTKEHEQPSFASTSKQVKTPRETVKNQFTHSKNPKVDKKAELNNRMRQKSSQREIKPVWNNVQRMNHQNRLVPKAVLTRTGKIPVNTARTSSTNTVNTARTSSTNQVNTARQNFNRQTVPTNAANIVNTVKPIVNNARPKSVFHKSVSPFKKSLNRTTTLRTIFSYQKVNTAKVNVVSAVGRKRETAVKFSAGCNWRPQRHYWHKVSKYNGGSSPRNCATFKDPLGRPKSKKAWVLKRI
ncbi:ribonuclease H-like domain-containing protein [Tanacetum coccineum]